MDVLMTELLKQSPLVILLIVGYYVMLKEKNELKYEAVEERKAHIRATKELNEAHALQVKELNEYIRESDRETQEAMNQIVLALEAVKMYIKDQQK